MKRTYCSYFDHRYLSRGLAMIRSLRRVAGECDVWILCLNETAERILRDMKQVGVTIVRLADLEAGDAALAAAKKDRSTIEYYFTLTPSLVRYAMERSGADIVTYLDGDLWFLADPEPVYRAMGADSVLIIPHGFAHAMRHLERFGIYNVGWVSFRSDARGRACLEWWRNSTNQWCFDRVEDGRFCEQGYLDQFPRQFEGVHVLTHRGANLAPWNVEASEISSRDGDLYANGEKVLFFHFHGLKRLNAGEFLTSHGLYRAKVTPLMRASLYRPYLREILSIEQDIEVRFGALDRSSVREVHGGGLSWHMRLKQAMKLRLSRWRGLIVAVD